MSVLLMTSLDYPQTVMASPPTDEVRGQCTSCLMTVLTELSGRRKPSGGCGIRMSMARDMSCLVCLLGEEVDQEVPWYLELVCYAEVRNTH